MHGVIKVFGKSLFGFTAERLHYEQKIFKGIVIIMSSWLACAFVVFLLAIFVTKCGNSMAFFSRPYLVVYLYGLPGLAALLIVNRVAASIVFKVNSVTWLF